MRKLRDDHRHHAIDADGRRLDLRCGVAGGGEGADQLRLVGSIAGLRDLGLDAELGRLARELLDVLVLLHQQLLRLRQVLQLEIDVASLDIVARLQPVDLEAELRDTIFIGRQDRVVLPDEQPGDVRRHQQADQRQNVGGEQRSEAAIKDQRPDGEPGRRFLGFWGRFCERLGGNALGVDEIGHADGAHIFAAPQLLELPDVVGLVGLEIGVGEQGVGELILRGEFLMAVKVLRGDADHLDAELLELRSEGGELAVFNFAPLGAVWPISSMAKCHPKPRTATFQGVSAILQPVSSGKTMSLAL